MYHPCFFFPFSTIFNFDFVDRSVPFASNENQFPSRLPAVPVLPKMVSLPSGQYDPYRSPVATNETSDELYKSMLERHRKRRLCNEVFP